MTELPTDYDGHVMRTSDEWCRIKQIQILDADGWRGHDAKGWSEPLTELDFEERAQVCTQRSIATQPAGEHHTGTLNLAGEGNAPTSPISDELVKTAAEHIHGVEETYFGPSSYAPHIAQMLARAALEAAYPAIRQQVAEEIAAAHERAEDDARRAHQTEGAAGNKDAAQTWYDLAAGYMRSAERAREIGRGA